jgi:hypothetical protein
MFVVEDTAGTCSVSHLTGGDEADILGDGIDDLLPLVLTDLHHRSRTTANAQRFGLGSALHASMHACMLGSCCMASQGDHHHRMVMIGC